jgi:hypothetical protein
MRIPHSDPRLRTCLSRCAHGVAVLVTGMMVSVAAGVFAQDEDARFSNWTKVESATEMKSYREAMRSGGAFDATSRGFLEEIALPQLGVEANRSSIERVRKKIRDQLLVDIANEKAAEEAGKTCMSFMQALAGKEDADPVVRVNAMLLIGELQGVDRKPWPPATAVLAQAAANTELPKAVRIAACVGLARHVDATKGVAEEQKRVGSAAVPAIMAILKEPLPPAGAIENDWMASRCLTMLSSLGSLTPANAAELVRILGEDGRSINVRVRAAAALAAGANPESQVDKAAVIKTIGEVAVLSLDRDVAAADKLILDRQYAGATGQPGGGPPGMMPPGMMPPGMMPPGMEGDPSLQPAVPQMIPREVCRRAAWRLAVLADAILSDDSKRGIALLGGDAPPAGVELSQMLRGVAMELDAIPDEATMRQALVSLKPQPPVVPAAEDASAQETPPATKQPAAKEAPAASAK